MRNLALLPILLLSFMLPFFARAEGLDTQHLLSVAGGIASPSQTTSLFENPAGLVFNRRFELLGEIASSNDQWNPLGYGGALYLGNGSVGGGLGLQAASGSATVLDFGLAADVESWNVAFGVAASYAMQGGLPAPIAGNAWGMNAGLLFDPRGKLRVGATAFGLTNGVDAYGAGIAGDASSSATLAVDGSIDRHGHGATVKPALLIHLASVQMTAGYGIRLDSASSSWLSRGTTLGLGVELGDRAHLQAYYNELALYFVGLGLRF